MDRVCIFCLIVARQAPASIVAETSEALAFMDVNQPTPGHVLVVPKAHFTDIYDIYDLDAAAASAVFELTMQVARAVKTALKPDGVNLYQANGRAAGQDVFHFHMHVVARYAGDRERIRLFWQPNLPPRTELDRLAAQIREAMTAPTA